MDFLVVSATNVSACFKLDISSSTCSFRLAASDSSISVQNPPGPRTPLPFVKPHSSSIGPEDQKNHLQKADVHRSPPSLTLFCARLCAQAASAARNPSASPLKSHWCGMGEEQTRRLGIGKTAAPAPRMDQGSVSNINPSHLDWNSTLSLILLLKIKNHQWVENRFCWIAYTSKSLISTGKYMSQLSLPTVVNQNRVNPIQ